MSSYYAFKGVNNTPVPLKSIDVVVRIKGFVADVESTLCYKNTESGPIEAVYEFPMDDQSAVYRFEAKIEDRTIVAECQKKELAKETYNDAVQHGYTATLMEEHDSSSDIFRCLVGNLPPDTEARIIFAYVTELSLQPDGKCTFILPTQLNPRYGPSTPSTPFTSATSATPDVFQCPCSRSVSIPAAGYVGSASKDLIHYCSDGYRPYTFSIQAHVAGTDKITSETSDTDKLEVSFQADKKETLITLKEAFTGDHDLRFDVLYEDPHQPKVIVEKGLPDKDGILKHDVVMLNFFPYLDSSDYTNRHEFIFVIDRSGSMSGSRIKEAKDALLLFLKSLPMGCYFNIIGFGSNFEVLFRNGSCEYSKESLKEACEHQKRLSADMGGTEILLPFKHIYNTPPMKTHTRQILLLTDGEVSNTAEVIEIVRKNASNTRVFALGIGEGASTALINGVARVGQGRAEFVKSGQKIQPLVMKIVKAMMQPDVSELELDWKLDGSPKFVQVPRKLPPMFAGDRFISYAIFPKPIALHGQVHLKGKIGERSLNFELSVDDGDDIPASDDSLPIHRLAAKAEIKQQQDDDPEGNKSAIVLLSTAANIISCHTSMVGVDKGRKELVNGKMTKRRVPLMLSRASIAASPPSGGTCSKSGKSGIVSGFFQGLFPSRRCRNDPTECAPRSYASRNKRHSYSAATTVSSAFKKFNPFSRKLSVRSMAPDYDSADFANCLSTDFQTPRLLVRCTSMTPEYNSCAPNSYSPAPDEWYGSNDRYRRMNSAAGDSNEYRCRVPNLRSASDSWSVPILPPAQAPPPVIEPQKRSKTDMMALISLQTFLGSWELTQELAEELLLDLTEMKSSSPIKVEDVWGTLLALACLHVKFAGERDEWEMIELKAKQWLMQQDMEGSNFDELLRKAKQVILGN